MGIFIERKRFCHFHSLEIPWSSVVSCGPACAISLSPIVPCGVLCYLCYPVVPCCSLSPVFPHGLACFLLVLASVVVFGVLLMPLVRVRSLVCLLVVDSLLGLFVRSFVHSIFVARTQNSHSCRLPRESCLSNVSQALKIHILNTIFKSLS